MLVEERQVFYAPNLFFFAFNCAYIFVYCLSTSSAVQRLGNMQKKIQNQSFAFTQYPFKFTRSKWDDEKEKSLMPFKIYISDKSNFSLRLLDLKMTLK